MGLVEKLRKAQMEFRDSDSAIAHVADQVLEIAIGLILIGGIEVLGINMIVNASTGNWDPNVKTMFQVILVILAIVADVYIFMNVAKKGKRGG